MGTPAPGDVRNGVHYVDSDNVAQVGTLSVPFANQVKAGIAFESGAGTIGTFAGTPQTTAKPLKAEAENVTLVAVPIEPEETEILLARDEDKMLVAEYVNQ